MGTYTADKTHEGVACMSNATKLSKKHHNPCHDFIAFQNVKTQLFFFLIQNQTFPEMLAYTKKALMEKLTVSLIGNCSDFSSLSALGILVL